MKKYVLFMITIAMLSSCSQKQHPKQEKVEKAVKTYVEKHLADAKTYESVAFEKIDSLKIEDTKIYKEAQTEKAALEANIVMLEDEVRSMEEAGQQEVNHLYTEAKEQLAQDKYELEKIDEKLKEWEGKGKSYVYSVKHKYKAKKEQNVIEYEEIFIIDQDGNVIEVIEY